MADTHGFIGAGADLTTPTLLNAYRNGVFPWFNAGDPICWWYPKSRCVIAPDAFTPAKSLVRTAKKSAWTLTTNQAFCQVMHACAGARKATDGTLCADTWISDEMIDAYTALHELGVAKSVEIWENDALVGGLYGVQIGALFCGESMFHARSNASKIAFWGLSCLAQRAGIGLIDCQLENPHLMSLGATIIPHAQFAKHAEKLVRTPAKGLDSRLLLDSLLKDATPSVDLTANRTDNELENDLENSLGNGLENSLTTTSVAVADLLQFL
ncbi:leucyl/phenylalanyl-tRNA--protein transferase [Moraxella caviae]|nr:leucyl/phenylalanyl-tRNA--protein transferase [Moraxella caviae]